ncbi:unnamed protein product [Somion occarium]|uniref:Uncharacterized protein n=1 Tax=Somion occarium TaxID=3059160 RepID=A0ABP1DUY2_9APHY
MNINTTGVYAFKPTNLFIFVQHFLSKVLPLVFVVMSITAVVVRFICLVALGLTFVPITIASPAPLRKAWNIREADQVHALTLLDTLVPETPQIPEIKQGFHQQLLKQTRKLRERSQLGEIKREPEPKPYMGACVMGCYRSIEEQTETMITPEEPAADDNKKRALPLWMYSQKRGVEVIQDVAA